jgi:peptidoglycan/LPS O-acetylase OafA/YrhL
MRKDYIDWLRNLSILFLFPYHTARVFDTINSFYVKGTTNVPSTNLIYLSYWFMPLLFLLAGFSSFLGLQKRSWKIYIKERFFRLFIPFLFGVFVIIPPQAYFARMFHLHTKENYITFLKIYFTDFSNWSEYTGSITIGHLWFIIFLFIISLIMLPIMITMIKKHYSVKIMKNLIFTISLFIVLFLLSLLPDVAGKNIFLYCGYFMIGFCIATNENIMEMIGKYRHLFGLITIIGIVGYFIEIYTIELQETFLFRMVHYLLYWSTLLAMIGYGKQLLNKKSQFMQYLNQGSFPIYILHQTFLVIVGYYVLEKINHGILPYLLILCITFIVTVIAYEIIKRIKILKIIFGIK